MLTLPITVDFRSKIPAGEQIFAQILGKITQNELPPGEQLPPVRNLASQLKVNFNTVARAYRMLDQAGLISTQQGRGTFVIEQENGPSSGDRLLSEEAFHEHFQDFLKSQAEQYGITQGLLLDWITRTIQPKQTILPAAKASPHKKHMRKKSRSKNQKLNEPAPKQKTKISKRHLHSKR